MIYRENACISSLSLSHGRCVSRFARCTIERELITVRSILFYAMANIDRQRDSLNSAFAFGRNLSSRLAALRKLSAERRDPWYLTSTLSRFIHLASSFPAILSSRNYFPIEQASLAKYCKFLGPKVKIGVLSALCNALVFNPQYSL